MIQVMKLLTLCQL